jgi:hypothetical protein
VCHRGVVCCFRESHFRCEAVVNAPGLGGQRVKFDPNKEFGPPQQAPLTAEYQKVYEASMADQAKGGLGNFAVFPAACPP